MKFVLLDSMILFFYGADEYRSRAHMRKTIDAFKIKRDPNGHSTHIFDATKDESSEILNALSTGGFFAEKKMVVLSHFLKSKNEELQNAITEQIKNDKIGDETALLFWEGDIKYFGKLFELLKSQKFVQEFALLTRPQCVGWVIERAREQGITITSFTASKLVDGYDTDLASLENVVAQLVAYAQGMRHTEITETDITYFLPPTFDDNTFHFVDALEGRNVGVAMKLLQDQWSSGKSPIELIGALLWKWRGLCSVRAYVDENKDARAGDIAKALKMHPFVAEKTLRAVRAMPMRELVTRYEELAEIDRASKRGGNATALLEVFTVRNTR